jgi:hypothetical protein
MKTILVFGLAFVFAPVAAGAQSGVGVLARYCPDGRIFTGVNYDDEGRSPLIELVVDPAFNEKMRRERFTGDLPVTPIYDLVFRIVPTINEYCLPQYDAEGNLVRKVDLPSQLPFTASIQLAGNSLVFVSSLQRNGNDDKGRPLYEWKLKGWESGIVSEGKMERLIRAVHNNDSSLKLVVDMKFADGTRKRVERGVNFALCAPVWGNGAKEMVYSRVAHPLRDFTYQASSIITGGFLNIDPFRAYQKHFSHVFNLRNYQGKSWTNVHLDAKEGRVSIAKDCGGVSATHISISPLVPLGDFASALVSGHFVQIASDVTKRFMVQNDLNITPFIYQLSLPLVALHEIGHAFAYLKDEYVALQGLAILGKNCALTSSQDAHTWEYNGVRYGDNNIKGCYGSESYRPSEKSLMRGAQSGETRFNVVSCGYIIAAIKGGVGPEYWQECMNTGWNTIKPTGLSASFGFQLASIFQSLVSTLSATSVFDASGDASDILIEHWSADGTITGETISAPTISYRTLPLEAVVNETDDVAPTTSPVSHPVPVPVPIPAPTFDSLGDESIFDTLSLDLKVNGSDGPMEVGKGERIVVSWASEGASRCRGVWSKKDIALSGTTAGRLARSGTVTIRAACIDTEGERVNDSVVVRVRE